MAVHKVIDDVASLEVQRLSKTGSFGWRVGSSEMFASAEAICILGLLPDSTPFLRDLFERVHGEDIAMLQAAFSGSERTGRPLDLEVRLAIAPDEIRHVRLFAQSRAEGAPVEFCGAVMDISERKNAEEALCRTQTYLAEAQRLTHTGSFCFRPAPDRLIVSEETLRIGGWPVTEIPTTADILARIHPGDRAEVNAAVARATQEHVLLEHQCRLVLPDQSIRHIHLLANPKWNSAGELEYVGAIVDVTEKRHYEDELRASADALRVSEHLARGQLAALSSTLDALAHEFDPDKLPKHVVTTILTQLGAQSVTIWERHEEDDLHLLGIVESGRFEPNIDAGLFGGKIPVSRGAPPLWSDALLNGMYLVIEDISIDPARIILPDGRTALWPTAILPTPFLELKFHYIERGVRALMIAPMMMGDQLTGIIGIRFTGAREFGAEEIELIKALAQQAMLAMQLMRISKLSRDSAVVAERNRMARDIHDTLAQGFTGVIVQLEAAGGALASGNAHDASRRIDQASQVARASLQEARRSVLALRPSVLRKGSLCDALADLLRRMSANTPVRTSFDVLGVTRVLPPEWQESLLRIAQQALTNTLRHAKATTFSARLSFQPKELELVLADNGIGFDVTEEHDGFGLHGMRERSDRIGARFEVASAAPVGTTITVRVPCTDGK